MKTTLLRRISRRLNIRRQPVEPVEGYDRWAPTYDAQPDNVVFALEAPLFAKLLAGVVIERKVVIDIGCGTGRHWPEILSRTPAELIGVDPSVGMLEQLRVRYPDARTICASGDHVSQIDEASCDVTISTLALAHLPSPEQAIAEWRRILKPGGAAVITDFHPAAIQAGMERTFSSGGHTTRIKHFSTDVPRLRRIAAESGFDVVRFEERLIDESVRALFERAQYLTAYEQYLRQPLVFGMHLAKPR